jgi:acetyltransferase
MIQSIKGEKILKGLRGEKPCDTRTIEELILRISRLLVDSPSILEIDVNPIKVFGAGEGAQAVDARVVLKKEAR